MKLKYLYFLFFYILLNINATTLANNIAFIDLDLILQNTNYGKNVFETIENYKDEKYDEILNNEKKLKSLEQNIINKKNIVSEVEFNNEVNEFQKKLNDLNKYKQEIETEFNNFRDKEISNFFNKINPFIQTYLNNNSIDVLFNIENIIIGKENLDITNEIIKIINQNIK